MTDKCFTADDARVIGADIGIDWSTSPFDVDQFRIGMNVELEHGLHDSLTNVSDDDPHVTGKIALAHLKEFPDYYTRLERMEEEAKRSSLTLRTTRPVPHQVSRCQSGLGLDRRFSSGAWSGSGDRGSCGDHRFRSTSGRHSDAPSRTPSGSPRALV